MKLEISKDEVEAALLDWVHRKFPGTPFNTVTIEAGYSAIRSAEFSWEDPTPKTEEA